MNKTLNLVALTAMIIMGLQACGSSTDKPIIPASGSASFSANSSVSGASAPVAGASSATTTQQAAADKLTVSRKISALQDELAAKRQELQLLQSQRVSYVSVRTQTQNKGIDALASSTSGLGGIASGIGGLISGNYVGGGISLGVGMLQALSNIIAKKKQTGEVATVSAAVDEQLQLLDTQIASKNKEISDLQNQLNTQIEAGATAGIDTSTATTTAPRTT